MGGQQDNCTCLNCGNPDAVEYIDTREYEITRWCESCGWIHQQNGHWKNGKLVFANSIETVNKQYLQKYLQDNFIAFPFEALQGKLQSF